MTPPLCLYRDLISKYLVWSCLIYNPLDEMKMTAIFRFISISKSGSVEVGSGKFKYYLQFFHITNTKYKTYFDLLLIHTYDFFGRKTTHSLKRCMIFNMQEWLNGWITWIWRDKKVLASRDHISAEFKRKKIVLR